MLFILNRKSSETELFTQFTFESVLTKIIFKSMRLFPGIMLNSKNITLVEESWSIEPQRSLFDLRLGELWKYRDVVALYEQTKNRWSW
jgi:hypothetical protein